MPLTYFLAQVIGLYVLIVGLTMLLWKERWWHVINEFCKREGQAFSYVLALIALPVGLSLVLSYNHWNMGLLPLVITIFGWIILLKSILVLALSPEEMGRLVKTVKMREWWYVYVAIVLIIGLYLTYAGLMA